MTVEVTPSSLTTWVGSIRVRGDTTPESDETGPNVNARDNSGRTALHSAASSPRPGAIRVLLEAGAVANVRGDDGTTPLGLAARFNESQAVDVLLDYGADPFDAG